MLFEASDTLFSRLSKKILSHYFYCKKLELGVFNVYHELPDYSRVHTVFQLNQDCSFYYIFFKLRPRCKEDPNLKVIIFAMSVYKNQSRFE